MPGFPALLTLLLLSPPPASALVNGKLAPPGMFPSVGAMSGCTATKIGPRHYLLAAHCYLARIGSARRPLLLEHVVNGQRKRRLLREHQVTLHPSWLETCSKIECSGLEIGTPADNPRKVDAAIVRLEWEVPGVPASPLSSEELQPGDRVLLAGRGCTQGIGEPG